MSKFTLLQQELFIAFLHQKKYILSSYLYICYAVPQTHRHNHIILFKIHISKSLWNGDILCRCRMCKYTRIQVLRWYCSSTVLILLNFHVKLLILIGLETFDENQYHPFNRSWNHALTRDGTWHKWYAWTCIWVIFPKISTVYARTGHHRFWLHGVIWAFEHTEYEMQAQIFTWPGLFWNHTLWRRCIQLTFGIL